ncbi:hypothetical protein D3C86_1202430 [compost metagenome]
MPTLAHDDQGITLLDNADQAAIEIGCHRLPLLAVITAGKQVAAQPVRQQQTVEGADAEVSAGVGRIDFHETLLRTIQTQQQTLLPADVKSARLFRQSIQVHAPIVITALGPRLPVLAVIRAVQQHAEGTHGKSVAVLIEHHIEKGCGQHVRRRRGTGGHSHFLKHLGCGFITLFGPWAVVSVEQGQQAAPVELHLPALTAIGGVHDHRIVTDDPAMTLVAKPHLHKIAGHRAIDLLPGAALIDGALDQPVQADANHRVARCGDRQQGCGQVFIDPLRRHVERIGRQRDGAVGRRRQQ